MYHGTIQCTMIPFNVPWYIQWYHGIFSCMVHPRKGGYGNFTWYKQTFCKQLLPNLTYRSGTDVFVGGHLSADVGIELRCGDLLHAFL